MDTLNPGSAHVKAVVGSRREYLITRAIAKANKYQDHARLIGDRDTIPRILDLARKLKTRALALAKPSQNRIRRRAKEIWEESGRPCGRDEEFWLRAEQELRETEELARSAQNDPSYVQI